MPRTTIQQLLNRAVARLQPTSPTPRLDADLLLAHVLGWSRARLLAERDTIIAPDQIEAFQQAVARRANREPVAYITGSRSFYGFDLYVDARVLIPRPETELLVDLVLDAIRTRHTLSHQEGRLQPVHIADVGTGSGAIAVALAHHLPGAQICAIDLSAEALAVAERNIVQHGVTQQVTLLQGDLLAPLPYPVDVIVSNPPYTVLETIEAAVRDYEPHLALDGGVDGLETYRRLLAQAQHRLLPHGEIFLEIGATQATAVSSVARTYFPPAHIELYHDLAGYDRVVAVRI